MTSAKDIREKLTPVLVESIENTEDGAGSDLNFAEYDGEVWIELGYETEMGTRAALDIHHLVGDIIIFLQSEGLIEK